MEEKIMEYALKNKLENREFYLLVKAMTGTADWRRFAKKERWERMEEIITDFKATL